MASSESDSDIDFESADEGEHSNETNKNSLSEKETVAKPDVAVEKESSEKVGAHDDVQNTSSRAISREDEIANSVIKNSNLTGPKEPQENDVKLPCMSNVPQEEEQETHSVSGEIAAPSEKTEAASKSCSETNNEALSEIPIVAVKETSKDSQETIVKNIQEDAMKSQNSKQMSQAEDSDDASKLEAVSISDKEHNDKISKNATAESTTRSDQSIAKEDSHFNATSGLSKELVSNGDRKSDSGWKPEIKEKDAVKRTSSDSSANSGSRVLLFKERKALEKTSKANSLNEKEVLDRLSEIAGKEEKKTSPGWGLGNWSASFISTAASSVSTFTSQVSQGFGTVLETVEASLGVPTPEDLASNKIPQSDQQSGDGKISNTNENSGTLGKQDSGEKMTPVDQDTQKGPVGSLLGGVSAFTRAFESTSNKMITGGLDTLELIGRKTMDILTDGDPGLRKRRSIFSSGGSTLSHVLREARLKAEQNSSDSEENLPHYSKLFDEFQGLVHLEALEMLSERCKSNVQKLSMESNDENLPSVLEHLKEICEDLPATDDTPDDEVIQDFEKLLDEHCRALPFKTKIEKIKSVQCSATAWLINCKEDQDKGEVKDPIEVYKRAITSLAELTAIIMEHFHKIAELALVTSVPGVSIEECAKNLTVLTAVFCTEVEILSSSFCQCLSTAADDSEDPDAVNPLITNVYLECSNSSTYIQDAFQLLIPVLQDLAIRHT